MWIKEWKSGQGKLCVRCGLTKKILEWDRVQNEKTKLKLFKSSILHEFPC